MDGVTFKFLQAVFAVFGVIGIVVAVSAIVAYLIFKQLGSKWLDNHFAERLEAFKHRQALEIEDTKFRINRLFDRASKLHQNEYIHLPGAWAKLVEAIHHAQASLGRAQAYANIQDAPESLVRQHMEARGYSPEIISRVLESGDRQLEYTKQEDRFRLSKAQDQYDEYMKYFFANQVFIPPDISSKFEEFGMLLRMALIERASELEFPNQRRLSFPALLQFRENCQRKKDELQKIVRDRLADTISEVTPEATP